MRRRSRLDTLGGTPEDTQSLVEPETQPSSPSLAFLQFPEPADLAFLILTGRWLCPCDGSIHTQRMQVSPLLLALPTLLPRVLPPHWDERGMAYSSILPLLDLGTRAAHTDAGPCAGDSAQEWK